jgi:RNA polymerase sigma-70 factor (ECF subfamily)
MTLDELYDRFGEQLYRYLVFRLGSCQDAEDVLQETFCRFARYSVRWKLVRNPRTFVFRCVRNEANRFLKRRLERPKDVSMNPGFQDIISSVVEGPDIKAERLLSEYLSRLPDDQMDVIVLKVFGGFTFEEIARICGCSINTAASRYRYGIARLRSILEGKQ